MSNTPHTDYFLDKYHDYFFFTPRLPDLKDKPNPLSLPSFSIYIEEVGLLREQLVDKKLLLKKNKKDS
jgi:hypothetical protein